MTHDQGPSTGEAKIIKVAGRDVTVSNPDKVLFAKYSGTEFKIDDVEYLILSEKDILGIVQE